MCGIIISNLEIPLSSYQYVKNRGPDHTNVINYKNINFVHFLLHISGQKTLQPIVQEDIVCIFNGEIYNYREIDPNALSDGPSIITCYKKYGEDFISHLDGEYTIVLFDFQKNRLYISSDLFKTKPLFYHVGEDIIISSYESVCQKINSSYKYKSIKHNETLIFDLETRKLVKTIPVYQFDLRQYKTDYNDFVKAFEEAVLKRYPEKTVPLITLSSGIDSGAIACCLKKYNKKATYITIPKNEHMNIIQARQNILGKDNHFITNLTETDKNHWRQDLAQHCEPFVWDWTYHRDSPPTHIDDGVKIGSMLGKSKIIDLVKKIHPSTNILYSGVGADEIMARNQFYSRGWGNVDYFPEDLSQVYPWANLFKGSMENYLKGEEYVGGRYSFETRYPFCDTKLVQEYLWLKAELKNTYISSHQKTMLLDLSTRQKYGSETYKPPLQHYLTINNFPYHVQKLGFAV